jgi:hypothetical protein
MGLGSSSLAGDGEEVVVSVGSVWLLTSKLLPLGGEDVEIWSGTIAKHYWKEGGDYERGKPTRHKTLPRDQ